MKKTYFLLSLICALTSCKSAIDKSVSEPLSNKEMIEICKENDSPYLETILADIGSKESFLREVDGGLFIKYADVTYRDIVEYRKMVTDTNKIKEFDEKYVQYVTETCDSAWEKINDIRESIKRDTSFNKYAKLNIKLEEEKLQYVYPFPKIRKNLAIYIDVFDKEIKSLGGIVSKASKEGASKTIVELKFFEVGKGPRSYSFDNDPIINQDTLDFVSGEYDYSINVLWVKKGDEILYTSKDYWDLLISNGERSASFSFFNSNVMKRIRNMYFRKENVITDKQLLKITNTSIISRSNFIDSLFTEQMSEKNKRAKEFYLQTRP